ncbi:iron ABC transporter substrate-binding protein [Pseudonocardia sulfidoxydans NBRC 16205]|uniref:Iron ABC transporter substrate-binding protein n=1 Tax=Pseudonocardia sulfidoxydans NBRC 16205 TaxID=1223511 RepID=A0A511DKB5_9PSEU|nr:ABC transporter substrate-binding protein [Pseudonocardia sulfidoxydans]GEL24867.1 iron ABC transporter substrate-binding protein [Pseudonocardia sulfidoxydans NBRC 16205]
MPALTRRRFLSFGAAAAAGLALAGCGDGGSAPAAGTTAPAAAGFPVTIDGVLGPVTVEREPQRVVSVGQYRDVDAAVALGVVPLATPTLAPFIAGGISPWVQTALAGRPAPQLLETTDGLPFEQIAGLRPDLILGADRNGLDTDYATLSRIAPTLSAGAGYNKDPWPVATTRVGTALGRADEAATLVADVEGRIASTKTANPGFAGRTFAFGPVLSANSITVINNEADASASFFAQLGMQLAPGVRSLQAGSIPNRASVSPERLDVLDADVLLLAYASPAARQAVEGMELFQRIPAVQRRSYVALDFPVAIALGFPSALSIGYGLDQVVPQLRSALAK